MHMNTTFMDGKPITFRPSSSYQIPSSLNFSVARIWLRVSNVPWAFLTTEWTVRLLSHVGHVEKVDHYGVGLPLQPYLRALVSIDLTLPLIPGCFLPLEDRQVTWVYFRYEGIFKFCKECGCVGHNTGRCNLSAYDAHRILQHRVQDLEDDGMTVLRTTTGIPLYTNMIHGLQDRFIHRNPRVNLRHVLPDHFNRQEDPYRYYHIPSPPSEDPHGSPEEFDEASPQPLVRPFMAYSPDNSQHHTNPPPDFSNSSMRHLSPSQLRERFQASPTLVSRYGFDFPSRASVDRGPPSKDAVVPDLDVNFPPPRLSHTQVSSAAGQHSASGTSIYLRLGGWAQRSRQLAAAFCLGLRNRSQGVQPTDSGTLEEVVRQGWSRRPPGPEEAGPSDWLTRQPPRPQNWVYDREREPPEL